MSAPRCACTRRGRQTGASSQRCQDRRAGSALTHATFVAHHGLLPVQDKQYACVFMVPMNTPGVKLISRASYENAAAVMGTPFDYPLSSRLDENDAIFVLENAFIPWEDVFVYGDVDTANNFFGSCRMPCFMAVPGSRSNWSSLRG